jgi:uroporphyrinogen-III synthase
VFALAPLAWSMPSGEFDGLLLTSASAVRLTGKLPDLPVHAVGEATAAAARQAGARVETVGEGGIDDLLARLPSKLRLLHLCGEERIAPTAPRQQIVAVPVYRAEPLPLPKASALEGRVLLVHSPAAGRRLAEITGYRATIRIAAISPAAALACGQGWERVEAAERPADAALLFLAAELCKE